MRSVNGLLVIFVGTLVSLAIINRVEFLRKIVNP